MYAYSGTLCSDCDLLEDIALSDDEVLVVEDKHYIQECDCVTMVSLDYLYDRLTKVKDYFDENDKTIETFLQRNAIRELKSLSDAVNNSKNKVSQAIVDFINEYDAIEKIDLSEYKKSVSSMVEKYSAIASRVDDVKWELIEAKNYPFDLMLFDGEGLISLEFCSEIRTSLCKKLQNNKYAESTSFQIRMPYIKGMVHACDFRAFFREKGINTINHIKFSNGKVYDLSKVKMILTKSQFKAEAFIKNNNNGTIKSFPDFINAINKYKYPFGIVNANKSGNGLCSLEYQFISTLPLSSADIAGIYDDNKWRIDGQCSKKAIIKKLLSDDSDSTKNEIQMYNLNQNFYYLTSKYKIRKSSLFTRLKDEACLCKFKVLGARRYLSGDLLELLYYISGDSRAYTDDLWLWKNQFYMPSKNPRNYKAVFLRSPHYSRNEIVVLNRRPVGLKEEREKYFSHLTGVVMINPRSLAAERMGGADYDGDTVLIIRDKMIVQPVLSNLVNHDEGRFTYEYLPCKIPSLQGKKKKYGNYNDRLVCLQNTFSSRIGKLSNEAVIRASIIYDKENSLENNHSIIAQYTILSGLEIDSAKSGRKPSIIFEKLTDRYEIRKFLESKKEYDVLKSSHGIKEMREKEYDFNGSLYGANILKVVSQMAELKLFSRAESDFRLKKNYDFSISKATDYPKALAIYSVYLNSMKLIRRVISKKAKQLKKTQLDTIYNQINTILKAKNINIDDFLDSFEMDNIKAFEVLATYIADNSYHFLINDEEKNRYLRSLFNDYDNKYFDYFTDFSNEGYRLLFLYLNYYLKKVTKIELNVSTSEREELDEKTRNLNKKEKKRFTLLYEKYEASINKILKNYISSDESIIKQQIIEYLKKEAEDLNMADIAKAVNVYESGIMFDVFFDKLKEYLEAKNG